MVLERNRFSTWISTVDGIKVVTCTGCPFHATVGHFYCALKYKSQYSPKANKFVSENCKLTEVIWSIADEPQA